jgi:hypothetical protein
VRAGELDTKSLSLAPVLDVFEELKLKDIISAYIAQHPTSAGFELKGHSSLRLPIPLIRSFFENVFARIEGKVRGKLAPRTCVSFACP